MQHNHAEELKTGNRFEFGANWAKFLGLLDEERIIAAENSLKKMLEFSDLHGKTFLDIGSGSGLFSLAARRLGATVFSFDYDPNSVACTAELKARFFPNDTQWTVEEGSALDTEYLSGLGKFDIVYSWGVLHHTGSMWNALENVADRVNKNGKLYIAIYNDTGRGSILWKKIKKAYCASGCFKRYLILVFSAMWIWGPAIIRDILKLQPGASFRNYDTSGRGMSPWHDLIDWVGGYPFEVARPEEILDLYRQKGFLLEKLKTCAGGNGCNEYVFFLS